MLSNLLVLLLNLSLKYQSTDMSQIEGKSFGFNIEELKLPIGVLCQQGQFVSKNYESVDVKISGDLDAFLSMLNDHSLVDNEALFIEGKISIAKQFQVFFSQLGIHWQQFFNQFIPKQINKESVKEQFFFAKDILCEGERALLRYLSVDQSCLVTKDELSLLTLEILQANQRISNLITKVSQ